MNEMRMWLIAAGIIVGVLVGLVFLHMSGMLRPLARFFVCALLYLTPLHFSQLASYATAAGC
ncbi:MAG: hypothetical protein QW751_01615 [Candidatus Aenigmatarchaeota archaeon]|nr:hypothetical protein [Candidatus Aenigmarchaeota archaeon]